MITKGSSVQAVRIANKRLIHRYIYKHSPISRVEIAESLGLSIPTVTAAITPQLDAGLLVEEEARAAEKSVGRPRVMLSYAPEAACLCGVEISPYYTHYVLTDLCGTILRSFHSDSPLAEYSLTLENLTAELTSFLQDTDPEKVLGVGVSLPGLVNGSTGRIYNSFRKGWTGSHFCGELSQLIGLPVQVENNVRARAIGADLFDRMVQEDPFAYFYVSRGISCHMYVHGDILYGQSAAAGEIGHTVMQRGGPVCPGCGSRGCLEALAGEWAVLRQAGDLLRSGVPTGLQELCTGPEALTIDMVLEAAAAGDAASDTILADAMDYLGTALANTINLMSPSALVLDGRMLQPEKNRQRLLEACQRHMFRELSGKIHFSFLPYQPERGARGAAAVVINRYLAEL